jgi:hypothetical protein
MAANVAAKLSVIFYIVLCLEVGIVLTVLPWYSPFGLSDWGDNFFLLYAAQQTGLQGLQHAVSSGWVRGAVTGLGLLNLGIAVWEIAHFRQTVQALLGVPAAKTPTQATQANNAAQPAKTDYVPDYERRNDTTQHSGQ